MPYSLTNPPDIIEKLPKRAKEIFIAAFNEAEKEYGEETAFKIAWAAVKKKYKKVGDKWVRRGIIL